MNKVLIPTKLSDVAANTLKTAGYEVIQDADTPLEKQVAAHPDAVALIVRSEKVTPEIMDALPSLKLVVRAGAGYDNIDIVYARKKNVDVMNTPGANSNAVAEEVMAMILAYYRHIVQADATTREGLWEKKKYMGSELTKKTVGIIGLGNIGRNLVKRLQGFEGFRTPCMHTGICADCNSPDRLCNIHMSLVKCFPKGRISVILMKEPGGL